jgi:hypothetical protein
MNNLDKGISKGVTHKQEHDHFHWKVRLIDIQSRKNKFEILPPSGEKL